MSVQAFPSVLLNRAVHLDTRVIRVGLLGYGQIGQAVARVAAEEHERLSQSGVELRCVRALVRDVNKARTAPPVRLTADPAAVLDSDVDVVVEALGGVEPARSIVSAALKAGIPVVTANKTLMAHHGHELRALAERHQTSLAFDAAVLAGVPFLGSLSRRPLISDARRLEGIINGTSHFIVDAIARGAAFERALADATARGYAEPDSSADVSGRDAAEKLTILLHLSGCRDLKVTDLPCASINTVEPIDFVLARRLGGTIKPVAIASLDPNAPGAWIGPAFVAAAHPFARLSGVANALQLTSAAGDQVLFSGPGAGPHVTAVTIVDDVVEAVTGAFTNAPVPAAVARTRVPGAALRNAPVTPWFVRGSAATNVAALLAAHGVPASDIVEHDGRIAAVTPSGVAAAIGASATGLIARPVLL